MKPKTRKPDTCCWVLSDGSRCGKKTSYVYELNDDGNKRRAYFTYCPEHDAKISHHEYKEWDDETI